MKHLMTAVLLACIAGFAVAADDPHAGHAHENHGDEGVAHELGHVELGGLTFEVSTHGEVEAGGEAVVEISTHGGPAPAELRAWIGQRNGRGSVKALLQADAHGAYHGHPEVPASLPHGSSVWLDVVTAQGRKRAGLELPEEEHGHGHAGHGHSK